MTLRRRSVHGLRGIRWRRSAHLLGPTKRLSAGGGGTELTYPGTTQLTGKQCVVTQGAPGTITITVPKTDVSVPFPGTKILYSVTASTQTLTGNAETPAPTFGLGGQLFNVIDVAPAFDFHA